MKILTKEQFRQMAMPQGQGKEVVSPRMELLPNDIGLINGNKYKITTEEFEDKVVFEKIEEFEKRGDK